MYILWSNSKCVVEVILHTLVVDNYFLMTETIHRLELLLESGTDYISNCQESILSEKITPKKWSKKEILGHLIDSGINNLQRFTEIPFENSPYKIRKYNQDQLVEINRYQEASVDELVTFWLAINTRILQLMKHQTTTSLNAPVDIGESQLSDLRFLIHDYVDHLEYHLKQVLD